GPRPVLVPRRRPGVSWPGGGGAKPQTLDCHARSAWPSSRNRMTTLVIALTAVTAPSSALHAVGLAAKTDIAPSVAPAVRSCCHRFDWRAASGASALDSTDR